MILHLIPLQVYKIIINIFKDKVFLQSIGNTVKWTVVNLLVQLVAAMLLALALNQKTERKICIQKP